VFPDNFGNFQHQVRVPSTRDPIHVARRPPAPTSPQPLIVVVGKQTTAAAEHVCGRFDCHRGFHHRRVSYAQRIQPTSKTILLLQRQTVPQQSPQIRAPT